VIALVVAEITVGLGLRDPAVIDRLPEGYQRPDRFGGRLATPVLPFFRLFPAPTLHLAAVGLVAMALIMTFLGARRRAAWQLETPDLLLALALLASLFHLLAAMGLLLVFAFARYDLWRLAAQPRRRLVLMGALLAVVLGWLVVVATAPERLVTDAVVARWGVSEPSAPGAILRALWSTFFGWPDFYRLTLRPFATELPELGLALIAALVWFVVAHRHDPLPDLLRHPGTVVLYWAVAMGLFTYTSSTSRYWFPVLAVLYTLLAVSLVEVMTRWRPRAEFAARRWAGLAFIMLFVLGPDFQPSHIPNVGDDAVRYRTGAFARFEQTWYPRRDVRTPAEILARRHAASPGARIVIDTLPALSYYLDREHAIYFDRCCGHFAGYSRERGSREMWSGQRLLSTPEELFAYAEPAEELWLVRESDPVWPRTDLAAASKGHLIEIGRDILGQDGRIELIRLRHKSVAEGRNQDQP
jgi:hypothetical protein